MEAHPVFWFVCWMCVFASGLLFFSSFFLSFWSSPFLIVILCSWAPGHCSSVLVLARACVLFVCVYVGVGVLARVCSSLHLCAVPLFSFAFVSAHFCCRVCTRHRVPLRPCLFVFVVIAGVDCNPCSQPGATLRPCPQRTTICSLLPKASSLTCTSMLRPVTSRVM